MTVDGGRRWPLDALCDVFGTPGAAVVADRCGVSERSVRRAAIDGLTDEQADEWAIRAGLHPVIVWGWDWVEAALDGASTDGGRPDR